MVCLSDEYEELCDAVKHARTLCSAFARARGGLADLQESIYDSIKIVYKYHKIIRNTNIRNPFSTVLGTGLTDELV